MRITLSDSEGERQMNGEVADDETWVRGCIDAAWAYVNYTGADSITVRSKDKPATDSGEYIRVCTVALEIHDDEAPA
jgi:hypothetical protein